MEGPIYGKPVLVFGTVYNWKGMPGVFKVKNYMDCREIINKILEQKIVINEIELKQYYECIEDGTVYNYTYNDECKELAGKDPLDKLRSLYREYLFLVKK